MNATQREKRIHGTQAFPFQIYPALETQESDLVPYHWHPETEFIMVEEGRVGLTIGEEIYTAVPGEVYFVNPQQLHEIRGGAGGTFHAFVFPMNFLQFARTDLAQNEWLAPMEAGAIEFQTMLPRENPVAAQVTAALQDSLAACRMKKPGYQVQVKADLLRILALIAGENLIRPCADRATYKTVTLREIVAYLDAHCTERLRLADVSTHFHMSPQYFCTFFKNNIGRTLTQHMNFLRIERASRLLRETNLPIMEVGMSVGFDNFSYFIKRFRETYGCTPSEYRQKT